MDKKQQECMMKSDDDFDILGYLVEVKKVSPPLVMVVVIV